MKTETLNIIQANLLKYSFRYWSEQFVKNKAGKNKEKKIMICENKLRMEKFKVLWGNNLNKWFFKETILDQTRNIKKWSSIIIENQFIKLLRLLSDFFRQLWGFNGYNSQSWDKWIVIEMKIDIFLVVQCRLMVSKFKDLNMRSFNQCFKYTIDSMTCPQTL